MNIGWIIWVRGDFVAYARFFKHMTEIKKSAVSGIKDSMCLYAADRRVSVTPWLGEPPCDPNPPASTNGVLEIFL